MKQIINNVVDIRQYRREVIDTDTGEITYVTESVKNKRKSKATSQASAREGGQDSVCLKTSVGLGFFKVDIQNGISYIIDAGKTKAGEVLDCLIKSMRYGNVAYIKPSIIALELNMNPTHVRKYLRDLIAKGYIAKFDTDNGVAYMVSPAIGIKGNGQHERIAKAMWLSLGNKRIKKIISKSKH
jgi:predicted transcriptional regulator